MKVEVFVESTLISMLAQKPVTQIHVSKLIEEVGICKGTFYKYYRDKYDLLQKCFYKTYYKNALSAQTLEDFLMGCLHAFKHSPKVVLHAMLAEDPDSLFSYHSNLVYEYLVKDRLAAGSPVEGERIQYALRFYADSITRMTIEWLRVPQSASPERLIETVRDMSPRILSAL